LVIVRCLFRLLLAKSWCTKHYITPNIMCLPQWFLPLYVYNKGYSISILLYKRCWIGLCVVWRKNCYGQWNCWIWWSVLCFSLVVLSKLIVKCERDHYFQCSWQYPTLKSSLTQIIKIFNVGNFCKIIVDMFENASNVCFSF
jgi:hypothetical protein